MYDIRNFFAPRIQGPGLCITVEQGYIQVGGVSLFVPRTAVSLAANATTYIYLDSNGAIATSNVGFPAGSDYPIAIVVTGASSVLTLSDSRPDISSGGGGGTGGVAVAITGNTGGVLATVSTGTLILAGGNNITLSQNGQTISVVGGAGGAGGSFSAGISGGNTAGNTGTVSNQLVLAGGNNITLSGSTDANGMTATISAFNQSVQTQNLIDASFAGNTAGALALVSSGTLILAGGNNVTLSQNGNTVTISAFNQSIQTQNLIDLTLAGNTSGALALVSSGTLTLAGGNNVTVSQNGNAVTISAFNQSVQTQGSVLINGSSGSIVLTAGPNISLSQNASTITISASNQSVQTQNCVDLSLAGNTSGVLALISSGTLILAGGNNVTVSQNAQSVTISAANQSAQTQNLIDLSLSGNTSGVLALISSGTGILAGGNNITLSQNGQSVTISGPNTVAQTNQSLGIYASSQTFGQSSSSTYDARSLTIVGSGIASVGWSNSSLILNVPSGGGAGFTAGISGGNTLGNTGTTSNEIVFAGGNNITLSGATGAGGMSVTVSAFNQSNQTLGIYASSQTTGQSSSSTYDARSLSIVGAGPVSVGWSNSSLLISSPALATNSIFYPVPAIFPDASSTIALANIASTQQFMWPFQAFNYISATQANLYVSISMSSSSNSSYAYQLAASIGIFTNSASTLKTVSSAVANFVFTNTSNNSTSVVSGFRALSFPLNVNMTPGDYWLGVVISTATTNTNWITINIPHGLYSGFGAYSGVLGVPAAASAAPVPGFGSASVAGFQTALAFNTITGSVNNRVFRVALVNVTA